MAEFFVGSKQGEFGLEEWSDLVGRFPLYSNRAIASALKSEGWRLQKIIKLAIQQGGAEGSPWAPLHKKTLVVKAGVRREKSRQARIARGVKVRARKAIESQDIDPGGIKPLAKLAGATRYYYDDSIKTVTIGFLDTKKRYLAKKHAQGFTYTVDRRMGKYLAAHGFPVKTGTVLKVPPRPVVSPVFEKEKANIIKNIKDKTINNIYRYLTGKGKIDLAEMDVKK